MEKKKLKKSKIIVGAILTLVLFIAWLILAFYSLNAINEKSRDVVLPTRFIAHRGFSSKYMENTIYAYNAASVESFFSGIETDVWRTLDGIFVCSHDINPFVDKSIKINEKNYEEIATLPLDKSNIKHDIDLTKEYKICTLREYLSVCLVSNKLALIEIKEDLDAAQTEELLYFLKGKISYGNVFLGSFNKTIIERIHIKAPYYKLLLFTSKDYNAYLYAELGYNIGVAQTALKENAVKKAHKKSNYAFVYTVEELSVLNKYKEMQVDFVICDKVIA